MSKQNSPKAVIKFSSSNYLLGKELETTVTLPTQVSSLEGWLYKQGGLRANKGWKRRWFLFDGYDLKYFKSESTKECLGKIPLGTMKEIQSMTEAAAGQVNCLEAGVLGKQTRFVLVTLNR